MLFGLGNIALFTGDYRRAAAWFEQCLAGQRDRGHDHLSALGTALLNLGDLARAQTGALLPPVHRAAYERMLEVVRAGLGEAGFAAAHGKLARLAPPDIIGAVMEGEGHRE